MDLDKTIEGLEALITEIVDSYEYFAGSKENENYYRKTVRSAIDILVELEKDKAQSKTILN